MDPFESYKNAWQQQKANEDVDTNSIVKNVKSNLQKQQAKAIFSNLFVSVSFAAVFIVIGLVWANNPDRAPIFYISLSLMFVLLLVTMAGFWAGIQFKKEDAYQSAKTYIKERISKLEWQKWMIQRYVPIYLILLLLIFYVYFLSILEGASLTFYLSAYLGVTAFFGLSYLLSRKKQRRNVEKIDNLIADLKEWESVLD